VVWLARIQNVAGNNPRRIGTHLKKLILFAAAVAVLCIHFSHYLPFIADDALISLRYSKRLIEGHGLTWNPGERIEGYSNLLWVLASAGFGLILRIDLVTVLRILGFVCMSAAIAGVLYPLRLDNWKLTFASLLVLLFLPLAAPIAVWTIGGMEQPLVAALLVWAVVLTFPHLEQNKTRPIREMLVPGLLFALLCLTRLDGPIFTAAAVAVILFVDRFSRDAWRKAVALASLPILFTLGQVIFRLAYYGEWIPNTALVKFSPSGKHSVDGWNYLLAGFRPILPLVLIAVVSVAISFWKKFFWQRMFLLCALATSWAVYVDLIGGDIFPAWRHLVPLIVLFVLMAQIGVRWFVEHSGRRGFVLTTTACVVLLVTFFMLQGRDEENFRAISERWEWDGQAVGTLLKTAFGKQQPLLAVDPAGCLPYWSELPTVDMLGLNDYYLPRHPPAGFGQGPIGHELGDGQYVLNRQPDLVIFLLPTGAEHGYFLSGRQMQEDPRFFRDYSLTRFETPDPRRVVSQIWVRNNSPRIGISRKEDQIIVPAFLLNADRGTVARLNDRNELVVRITRETPASLNNFDLPPGIWRVEAQASDPSLRIRIYSSSDTNKSLLDSTVPATFNRSLNPSATIKMELVAESDTIVELTQLLLTRRNIYE
jgi:arabinofuranosyltransferase